MSSVPGLSLNQATDHLWDAIVIGAGPAGALAARELARKGATVLLVDKAEFPRWKVCGCCINGLALTTLKQVGLGDLLRQQGAVPLTQIRLAYGSAQAGLPLQNGMALSREALDLALIKEAIKAGACFLPSTESICEPLDPDCSIATVTLRQAETGVARARTVVIADGLHGQALKNEPSFVTEVTQDSHIGAGGTLREVPDWIEAGTIYMACGRMGYVGMVRLSDGRTNLAAALDRRAIHQRHGVGAVVETILNNTDWPSIPGLSSLRWRGTPGLTRHAVQVAGHRWFVVGDAAGYVEPFTGEGMAWAMASAKSLAPLALEAVHQWHPGLPAEWAKRRRKLLSSRLRMCRLVSRVLRSPLSMRLLIRLLSWMPFLASPVLSRLSYS